MRTARSRNSGVNFFDFFMAPSSQRLEPPRIPGRFTQPRRCKCLTVWSIIEVMKDCGSL
jgi:hypothetical protein